MRNRLLPYLVLPFFLSALAEAQVPDGIDRPTDATEIIRLWPGAAPGTEGDSRVEQISGEERTGRNVRNVAIPTLTYFPPEEGTATGAAVIIAPGGGNVFLSIDSEGYQVARRLASHGLASFVLKYRLRETPVDDQEYQIFRQEFLKRVRDSLNAAPGAKFVPLEKWRWSGDDARRAVQVVRESAGSYGVDPDKIGLMGFSAGGSATASAILDHDSTSRPDFAATIYALWNTDAAIPEDAPPTFFAVSGDDRLADGNLSFFLKWKEQGKAGELHLFERGGHGYGMRRSGATSDHWIDEFEWWLQSRGLMKPTS